MSKTATPKEATIEVRLKKLDIRTLKLRLVGDSPMICHAWSEKAKAMMLSKMMKQASAGRAAKDPVEEFKQSLYRLPDGSGFGFPVIGFKAAAVDAANDVELKKTAMRGSFHIPGELAKIIAPSVNEAITDCDREYWKEIEAERKHGASMRSDMVRVGMGVADIRFRAQFVQWSTELQIRYNASVISPDQIVNLFNVAGFSVGVGEHRPQKDGSNGMFHVE